MQFPLHITIRDIPHSPAIESEVRKQAEKLTLFYEKIISCRAVIDVPQKHQHQGRVYNVRLDIAVPREEIVVNRIKNEDLYVAIRRAFTAARRRLQKHAAKLRSEVKNHVPLVHGKVTRLFPTEDYGFIEAFDGREFYFHRNNMAYPDYDQLSIGTEVQFLEIVADEGLQANRVSAGKHQPLEAE